MKSRFDDRIAAVPLPEPSGNPVTRRNLMRLLAAGALFGLPRTTHGALCAVGAFAHEVPLTSLAFFPDGQTLISAARDKFVKFWTVPAGALFRTVTTEAVPTQIAVSPTGTRIAVAMHAGHLELWSADGAQRRVLSGHTDTVNAVAFTPDSARLVSVSQDRTTKLWSVTDGKLLRSFSDAEAMSQIGLPPIVRPPGRGGVQPRRLAVTAGSQLYLRFLTSGEILQRAPGRVFAISRDGKLLAAHDDSRLYMYAFPSLTPLGLMLENQRAASLAFSMDGKRLAVTYASAATRLYSTPDLTLIATLPPGGSLSPFGAMDPRNRFLAVASDRSIYLYALPSGAALSVCFMDIAASAPSSNGLQYIDDGELYTLGCGGSIPFGYSCCCNCVPGNCPCVYDSGCSCDSDMGCNCDSDMGCNCDSDMGCACDSDPGCGCVSDPGCGCVSDAACSCVYDTGCSCLSDAGCSCVGNLGCSCDFDYGCGCVDDYGCGCISDYGCGCVSDYGCGCVSDYGCGCDSDYGCGCVGDYGCSCDGDFGSPR